MCHVSVRSQDHAFVDRVIAEFDRTAPDAQVPPAPEPIEVTRYCTVTPVHWESLPLLSAGLKRKGIEINEQSIEITRYPTTIQYPEWEPVVGDIRKHGEPKKFHIALGGKTETGTFRLTLSKNTYLQSRETYLYLHVSGIHDEDTVDEICRLLELKPDDTVTPPRLDRTAFIAHRFDAQGKQLAVRLARFLALLGFDVKTGRGFSPEPVGDKVKKRLKSQAVIFVILTPGNDATWLTQESALAHAEKKPQFVLRDMKAEFKSGILGDLEYIPFTAPHIDGSFIAVLEGLEELGFLRFAAS